MVQIARVRFLTTEALQHSETMLRNSVLLLVSCVVVASAFSAHLDHAYERSELVQVRSMMERNENGDRQLHVRAFGEDHHVNLKLANDIFSPEFRMFTAKTKENGAVTFHSTAEAEASTNEKREEGQFYRVDGKNAGSLFLKDSDGLKVEGLINERLLITPTSSPQADRDGNLYDHVVYQLRNLGDDYQNDIVIPPGNDSAVPVSSRQSGSVPSTVTVEVLVMFDHLNTKNMNNDQNRIKQYLGIFWNFVQDRYVPATNPNVKIAISGLLTFNSDNDQPFIKDKKIDDSRVQDSFLGDMRTWLKNGASGLPRNDVVMLQTGMNAGSMSGGQFRDSVAGKAYMGTACSNSDGYNSGFSEDKAPYFTGMLTAAHELGHMLSLDHDGSGNGAACSNGDGYIMATHGGGQREYKFSSCSLSSLKTFASRKDKSCLWDNPQIKVSLQTKSPASMAGSLDDQCRSRFNDNNYFFRAPITDVICKTMWCTTKAMNGAASGKGGALDGTPCDLNKMCIEGECRPNGVGSLDQQCKHFGGEFIAWAKDDANICSRLWCTKNNYNLVSIGGAADGSVCGSSGSCLSQQCIGQVSNMDDQCKNSFGNEYFAQNKEKSDEVCSRLWCTKDNRGLTSYGGAHPNTPCAPGKVCRNKQCVAQ